MERLKFSVVFLLVSVTMCSAMSSNELEEFSDFLKKTSVLDQNLKTGTDTEDSGGDEEEVSDHAWEESGKFEGDLILNERQRRQIVEDVAVGLARNGLRDSTKRWPDNEVVFYVQREHFSGAQLQAIHDGISDLAQASCVKFRPYRKGDRDAVVIQGNRRGCFSQVGYQGGYQVLNLSGRHPVGRGCFRHGTVVHELLHTLGFYHMQSSPDRDDYIDVVWENIVQPAKHNFRKYNAGSVSDFGVGYDYDSVLHYSRRAFSSNGGDTLVPKSGGAQIGQRIGLSDKDTQKLNKMYCDADSDSLNDHPHVTHNTKIKKKSKNKPFDGHGIGYHQGKTVVIKLPEAETFKLAKKPSHDEFNYFSKSPEALLPKFTEGFGIGKEVKYEEFKPMIIQHLPVDNDTEVTKDEQEVEDHKNYDFDIFATKYPDYKSNTNNFDTEENKVLETSKDSNRKDALEHSEAHNAQFDSIEATDYDLNDAFDRLGKIIKSHVYPSQKNHHQLYSDIKSYEQFSKTSDNPGKIISKFTEEEQNNKNVNPNTTVESRKDDSHENDVEKVPELHSPAVFTKDFKILENYDKSFGTANPFRKIIESIPSVQSQYALGQDKLHDKFSIKDFKSKINNAKSFENNRKYSSSLNLPNHSGPSLNFLYEADQINEKLKFPEVNPTYSIKIIDDAYPDDKSPNDGTNKSLPNNKILRDSKSQEEESPFIIPTSNEYITPSGFAIDKVSEEFRYGVGNLQGFRKQYSKPEVTNKKEPRLSYKLFGEAVPLSVEWFSTDNLHRIPAGFKKNIYFAPGTKQTNEGSTIQSTYIPFRELEPNQGIISDKNNINSKLVKDKLLTPTKDPLVILKTEIESFTLSKETIEHDEESPTKSAENYFQNIAIKQETPTKTSEEAGYEVKEAQKEPVEHIQGKLYGTRDVSTTASKSSQINSNSEKEDIPTTIINQFGNLSYDVTEVNPIRSIEIVQNSSIDFTEYDPTSSKIIINPLYEEVIPTDSIKNLSKAAYKVTEKLNEKEDADIMDSTENIQNAAYEVTEKFNEKEAVSLTDSTDNIQKPAYEETEKSNEKDTVGLTDSTDIIQKANYEVTEKLNEKDAVGTTDSTDNIQKAKYEVTEKVNENSEPPEPDPPGDFSGFEEDIEERLANIMKSYTSFNDDYDISPPYSIESSEFEDSSNEDNPEESESQYKQFYKPFSQSIIKGLDT